MNEYTIVFTSFGALIGLAIGCLFYALGGRNAKWQRRIVGSAVIAVTVNVSALIMKSWSVWLIGTLPILILAFTLGYGADDIWKKIFRRTLYSAAVVSAGLLCAFALGGNAWWLLIPHAITGAMAVFLGVRNPLYAAAEEVFVCASLNLFLISYPFITF